MALLPFQGWPAHKTGGLRTSSTFYPHDEDLTREDAVVIVEFNLKPCRLFLFEDMIDETNFIIPFCPVMALELIAQWLVQRALWLWELRVSNKIDFKSLEITNRIWQSDEYWNANKSLFHEGKIEYVMKARKMITATLQTQSSLALSIPQEHHRHILGKGGKKLADLENSTNTKIQLPRQVSCHTPWLFFICKNCLQRNILGVGRGDAVVSKELCFDGGLTVEGEA
jgi:hypothetical protein